MPVGALLSGGLDSSLVAAIAARRLRLCARGVGAGAGEAGAPRRLKTFAIGMPGSADLAHARLAAAHIGSEHHEVVMTEEAFWCAVPEVAFACESFDITSIRASVGNYLVARYVRERTDVRVLLNGDGADELSGSYLYFRAAPSDAAFEAECARLLRDVHAFDVLRSDRCVAAWGLEARTPFLDRQFAALYLSVATALRRPGTGAGAGVGSGPGLGAGGVGGGRGPAEKQLLREAFDTPADAYLPDAVLWRRKEAFSDGVSAGVAGAAASAEKATAAIADAGRSWFEVVKARVAAEIFPGQGDGADAPWRAACMAYATAAAAAGGKGPPSPYTQESLWYRSLHEQAFSRHAADVTPYYWLPKWSGGATDPSARMLPLYDKAAPST